jgi:5-methylthioadenosine/S-adenosylhomocysteine deaminase
MTKGFIHVNIYTMDKKEQIINDGGILYDDDIIVAIGNSQDIEQMCVGMDIELEDGQGKFIFPGLINTHTHLYQGLFKGLGSDMNLKDWWPKVLAPIAMNLNEEHLENGVRHGIAEALKTGVTTLVDFMQFHPVKGLSEVEIKTAKEMGIRLVYGRGFRDAGENMGVSSMNEKVEDVFNEITYLKEKYEKEDDMVKVWLAPAAIWTFSDKGLEETRNFATKTRTPIMMHMFETEYDDVVCLEKFKKKAIDYYVEKNFLGPDLLAVHSVHVTEEELDIYRKYEVKVAHNPVCNMYLGSGTAPVIEMLKKGITVGLGTDGAASNNSNDMIEVLKTTILLHRNEYKKADCLNAYDVLKMATIEGAKCLGMEDRIGSLEIGKKADMLIFNPSKSFKTSPAHDGLASFVYSGDYRAIEKVIVNGKVVLKDGKLVNGDEDEIIKDSIYSAKNP